MSSRAKTASGGKGSRCCRPKAVAAPLALILSLAAFSAHSSLGLRTTKRQGQREEGADPPRRDPAAFSQPRAPLRPTLALPSLAALFSPSVCIQSALHCVIFVIDAVHSPPDQEASR